MRIDGPAPPESTTMAVSRRSQELPVADTPAAADPDRARLHQLGYKQELKRGLS